MLILLVDTGQYQQSLPSNIPRVSAPAATAPRTCLSADTGKRWPRGGRGKERRGAAGQQGSSQSIEAAQQRFISVDAAHLISSLSHHAACIKPPTCHPPTIILPSKTPSALTSAVASGQSRLYKNCFLSHPPPAASRAAASPRAAATASIPPPRHHRARASPKATPSRRPLVLSAARYRNAPLSQQQNVFCSAPQHLVKTLRRSLPQRTRVEQMRSTTHSGLVIS
ncbi:hypothetical protein CDD82_4940 [Ophiocordyceps australis]|uniref:Uncharacterized protein n=1 Tax=Ophiocordyceps australis TaxID=1399860 RepID=A0A2C5Z4W7_9HYPO|nr:hypothetical protein CDD82_4940 [Ophiocordyceps australis]